MWVLKYLWGEWWWNGCRLYLEVVRCVKLEDLGACARWGCDFIGLRLSVCFRGFVYCSAEVVWDCVVKRLPFFL